MKLVVTAKVWVHCSICNAFVMGEAPLCKRKPTNGDCVRILHGQFAGQLGVIQEQERTTLTYQIRMPEINRMSLFALDEFVLLPDAFAIAGAVARSRALELRWTNQNAIWICIDCSLSMVTVN